MVPHSEVTLQQFPQKALQAYGHVEFSRLDRKLAMFHALCKEDQEALPEYEQRVSAIAECIEANTAILSTIAESAGAIQSTASNGDASPRNNHIDEISESMSEIEITSEEEAAREKEERKMLSREVRRGFVLLARDWSAMGQEQRKTCYGPIIEAVEDAYGESARSMRSLSRSGFRVLVPGAGAGRLAWELVKRGFAVEGCEISFTALLVGNFVLNSTSEEGMTKIYPFAHDHSNVRSAKTACRGVSIPDVNPKDIPHVADFAMRAGNFVDAYEGQDNSWDVVASCMAFNLGDGVIGVVRRISEILKPGGIWTFVGPLPCLDGGQMDGIHLSVEEFLGIVRQCGLKVVRREEMECLHSADPQSLRSIRLNCSFVIAVKS